MLVCLCMKSQHVPGLLYSSRARVNWKSCRPGGTSYFGSWRIYNVGWRQDQQQDATEFSSIRSHHLQGGCLLYCVGRGNHRQARRRRLPPCGMSRLHLLVAGSCLLQCR